MVKYEDKDIVIKIADDTVGQISMELFVQVTGCVTIVFTETALASFRDRYVFSVCCPGYFLELGFRNRTMYLIRDEYEVEVPIDLYYCGKGDLDCNAGWSINEINLLLVDETLDDKIKKTTDPDKRFNLIKQKAKIVKTPPTYPPGPLITWAREKAIIPKVSYRNEREFWGVVVSALGGINDKARNFGLDHAFWDIDYEGNRIVSRKPKQERDVLKIIRGLLTDIAIIKNLEIIPEYDIGGGNLDFLVSGRFDDGSVANVCLEFKNAHSRDLIRGVRNQLPTYMRAKGCRYGVYCVLYYKGFCSPVTPDFETDFELLAFLTGKLQKNLRSNIKIMALDFSPRTPPSKT